MNSGRVCIIVGHDLQVSHVCLYQNYDQKSRWLCQKCFNSKAHNHGSEIQDQIIQMKQFEKMMYIQFLRRIEKKSIINRTYDQIGNILAVSISLSKDLSSMVEFAKNLHKQKYSNTAWLKLNEIRDFSKLFLLESQVIEQLVVASRDLNYSQDLMKQVDVLKIQITKFEQISNHINQLNKNHQKAQQELIILQDLSKIQASIQQQKYQETELKVDFPINTIQVSNNLKYIAAGGNFNLTIWNHSNLQIMHQFQLLNQINILKFTFDSSTLYVASQDGYIYQFLPEKSFINILRLRIHQSGIIQFFLINNNIIMTCDKDEIKKTDCSKSETLLVLKTSAKDFDYDISRNQLLTNHTQNVSLWDGKYGYVIIDKNIEKLLNCGIRFVGNYTQILINFVETGFQQYNLDLNKKQFELIRQVIFIDKLNILSFSLTQKQQFIVLYDYDSIQIRSFSGSVILTLKHQLQFINGLYNCIEQVELMKTLVVTNGAKVKLFKAI